MHLTGVGATVVEAVATDEGDVVAAETVVEGVPGTGTHPHGGARPTEAAVHGGATGVGATGGEHRLGDQLRRSSSSSSSSDEEESVIGTARTTHTNVAFLICLSFRFLY